jgi:hypothetical protein
MHSASDNEPASHAAPMKWSRIDDLREVRERLASRDQVYAAVRAGRLPTVRLSSRRFLVPVDWLEILAREPPR